MMIPINRKIMSLLEEKHGFKREYAKKCLVNNKHNHVTTTYYLLYQKYGRLGMLNKEDEVDLMQDNENKDSGKNESASDNRQNE